MAFVFNLPSLLPHLCCFIKISINIGSKGSSTTYLQVLNYLNVEFKNK